MRHVESRRSDSLLAVWGSSARAAKPDKAAHTCQTTCALGNWDRDPDPFYADTVLAARRRLGTVTEGGALDIYQTGMSTKELTEFYQEKMADEGWTEEDGMPMGGMALLVFTKDDKKANVMILGSDSDGGSMVLVSVE